MIDANIEVTIKKLYNYCLKLSGSTWLAEDLVQESMIKVYRLNKEEPERELTLSFMYTVARNLFIDEMRRSRESHQFNQEIHKGTYDFKEYDSLIEILLSSLPLKQAMLLTLKDVFGYSSKEIAAMLRISNESVKTALHRSRKKLLKTSGDLLVKEPISHQQITAGLAKAIKNCNPYPIFYYYRLLDAQNYRISSNRDQSVCRVVDPDGNVLELCK